MMDKFIAAHFDLFRAKERAFNFIETRGPSVRKTIYNVEKGSQEVFFYKNLPRELKAFYPRFKKFKKTKSKMVYEMELIRSYDTSVWYLRKALTPKVFSLFLKQIESYLGAVPALPVHERQWKSSTHKLIVEKLDDRWHEYTRTNTFKQLELFFQKKHGVNLRKFKNTLVADLKKRIRHSNESFLHFSHGDLCFSNILMGSSHKLKLIDPKGATSKAELYFTLYYDLAKLSHSVNGNYDGILSGGKIDFTEQKKIFARWVRDLGFDLRFIRLIESSLFLSMLPLHLNRPETHMAFIKAAVAAHKASQ